MLLEGVACGKPVVFFNLFDERAPGYLLEQFASISVSRNPEELKRTLENLVSPSRAEIDSLFPSQLPAEAMTELVLGVL